MFTEFLNLISQWEALDTWIVVTAGIAAMACALPGNYLVLRRQSMTGDALSHTALPGIVFAFLFAHWLQTSGWISQETYFATRQGAMFFGAVVIGVLTAVLTQWLQKLGKVESSAALGVVYCSFFAFGLLLVRVAADSVHLDPDCALFGTIETVVLDTWGQTDIPRVAVVCGVMLAVNLLLVIIFYKELAISAFDAELATTLGFNSGVMHYALMAVTAATVVAAFEGVGSILVVAMLIAPAATANLLTDRLSVMIGLSMVIAALSALLGHAMAISIPPMIFSRLGFDRVLGASSAGMMAVACGLLFLSAMFLGPRHGIISRFIDRLRLSLRIVCEDVLGLLYRLEEKGTTSAGQTLETILPSIPKTGLIPGRVAVWRLTWTGAIEQQEHHYRLTESGRETARRLVRSHRLWESYMAKHFNMPDDHLHETAARVEHFLDPEIRNELAAELEAPAQDPHGRAIPSEGKGE